MALEKHQEKSYPQGAQQVYQAALQAVANLDGKLEDSSAESLKLVAKFPKTIQGNTLGERTRLTCVVKPQGEASLVVVDAYPLDALERKLMFGARKGVTQTVVNWFTDHLEHQLGTSKGS